MTTVWQITTSRAEVGAFAPAMAVYVLLPRTPHAALRYRAFRTAADRDWAACQHHDVAAVIVPSPRVLAPRQPPGYFPLYSHASGSAA